MFGKRKQDYEVVVMNAGSRVMNNPNVGYYFNKRGRVPSKGEKIEAEISSLGAMFGGPQEPMRVLLDVREVIAPLRGLPMVVVEEPKQCDWDKLRREASQYYKQPSIINNFKPREE